MHWIEPLNRRWRAGVLMAVISLSGPSMGLAEDGGGVSLNESLAGEQSQLVDLLANGANLHSEGVSDLFQHDGDLNQTVDLNQTQVPANAGEVTQEQMGRALENRSLSEQGTGGRGGSGSSRSR